VRCRCSVCDGDGELLCCEGCANAFHVGCLDPPPTRTALAGTAQWFCSQCVAAQRGTVQRGGSVEGRRQCERQRNRSAWTADAVEPTVGEQV
jgi:hypothetical protein